MKLIGIAVAVAALVCLPARATPTVDAGFPVTASQDFVNLVDLSIGSSFNVTSGSLVVVLDTRIQLVSGTTVDTISWSGGTPSGASAFTKIVDATVVAYSNFDHDASAWVATTTGALTGVNVVAHSSSTSTAGSRKLTVYAISSAGSASGTGTVNTNTNGVLSVSIASVAGTSLILGQVMEPDSSPASFTAQSSTVFDSHTQFTGLAMAAAAFHSSSTTSPWGSTDTFFDRLGVAIEIVAGGAAASVGPLRNMMGFGL